MAQNPMTKHDPDGLVIVAILFLILLFWLTWRQKKIKKKTDKGDTTITTQSGVRIESIGEETTFPQQTTHLPSEQINE